jgi:hypothetical protein
MINNKNDMLKGQISMFDFEFIQPQEPKTELKPLAITKPKENHNKFIEIINLYSDTAARIVKRVSGALLVEIDDKTLYFNAAGVNELELKKDIELMPADEILVVNQDKEANDLQLKKLKDMHIEKYIKRKGDANIIIPFPGKSVIINPRGWVLEYLQKSIYHDSELFVTEMAKENTDLASKITEMDIDITKSMNGSFGTENNEDEEVVNLGVGDRVEFNYDGPQIGNISSIYNNGETVNVIWDHKHTAFYYKNVRKAGGI